MHSTWGCITHSCYITLARKFKTSGLGWKWWFNYYLWTTTTTERGKKASKHFFFFNFFFLAHTNPPLSHVPALSPAPAQPTRMPWSFGLPLPRYGPCGHAVPRGVPSFLATPRSTSFTRCSSALRKPHQLRSPSFGCRLLLATALARRVTIGSLSTEL